jgi:hypothetical protein
VTLILPQVVARELYGHALPPRALVLAVALGLLATLVGPLFSAITSTVPWAELAPLKKAFVFDGVLAILLVVTSIARRSAAGRVS